MQIIYPYSKQHYRCPARFSIICAEEGNEHGLLPDKIINEMIIMYNSYAPPVKDVVVYHDKGAGIYDIRCCYPDTNIMFLHLNITVRN